VTITHSLATMQVAQEIHLPQVQTITLVLVTMHLVIRLLILL
jgi:hypothetical protein